MTLPSLIASLREAGEGSRELDEAVWRAANPGSTLFRVHGSSVRPFTTSLDAILGLIREKLPDEQAVWQVGTDFGGWVGAHICCHTVGMGRPKNYNAQAATPALALCIALLLALEPGHE